MTRTRFFFTGCLTGRRLGGWLLRLAASCVIVCVTLGGARGENYAPRVGELHADFTLPSIADGRPVSLRQFRGKKVLLIHFASW